MKKTLTIVSLMLLCLLGSFNVVLADEVPVKFALSAEKTSFVPGQDYVINVDVANTILVKGLQGDVKLPKGLTFVDSEDEETQIFDMTSRVPRGQSLADNQLTDSTARFIIVPVAMDRKNIYMAEGEGAVCTFKVHCTDSLAAKSVITLYRTQIADTLNEGIHQDGFWMAPADLTVTNSRIYPDILLSIDDVTVRPGTPVKLHVMLDNSYIYDMTGTEEDALSGLQFDMVLPKGASLTVEDDDYTTRLARNHKVSAVELDSTLYGANRWRILLSSITAAKIKQYSGEIFSLTLHATDEIADTSYIKVSDQVFATTGTASEKYVVQRFDKYNANTNAEFEVMITRDKNISTGINEIRKVRKDDRVYNLAGQRVSPNTKGLVIINGKKVIR